MSRSPVVPVPERPPETGSPSSIHRGRKTQMFGSTLRQAAMVVALPALVASATASPALASGSGSTDYYKKVVHVKICKEIKDKNHKFYIHAWTYNSVSKDYYDYVDKDDVYVHNGKCKDVDLEYGKYKKVVVEEYDIPYGYEFDAVKCYDDYGKYKVYYDKKTACDFEKDWVKIVVVNKKKSYEDK